MTKRRIEIIRYRRTTIVRSSSDELPDEPIKDYIDVTTAEREETKSAPLTPNPKQVPLRTRSKSGDLFKRLFRR
jgi:hypothetical protein